MFRLTIERRRASDHYLVGPEIRNAWWAVLDLNQ